MKNVRPTSGKTLLALFNILGPLKGQSFLDLFSGTGRIAMKAWQSGAQPVVAVEKVRNRCAEIPRKGRGQTCPLVLNMDVRRGLDWLSRRDFRFDVIFADPPYLCGWMETLIPLLGANRKLLKDEGVIVIEHSMREPLPAETETLFEFRERKYGETRLAFLSIRETMTDRGQAE